MKKLIIILMLLSGCASAPSSGYIEGVLDSGALEIKSTDTQSEKQTKKLAVKVAKSAQSEIKSLNSAVIEATVNAERQVGEWKGIALLAATGAVLVIGLFYIWRKRMK